MILNFSKQFILLILFVLLPASMLSQQIKLSAKLDSMSIELGDQVWFTLSAEQGKNDKVNFPVFKNNLIGGIDIIETSPADTLELPGNRIKVSQKHLITAFEDSIYKIPRLPFKFGKDTLYSDSIMLMVNNILLDSTEFSRIDTTQVFKIYDIKEPINTPWTLKEFLQLYYPYLIVVSIIVLVFFLVRYYLRRLKANKPIIKLPEKPKEPAHIVALKALDLLKSKKLWQSEKVKEYYSELTEILKQYIENRFQIHTFERTSHEVLESIKHSVNLEKEIFLELKKILGIADLAKFAKLLPLADENDLCLKLAYHFVEITAEKATPDKNQADEDNLVEQNN